MPQGLGVSLVWIHVVPIEAGRRVVFKNLGCDKQKQRLVGTPRVKGIAKLAIVFEHHLLILEAQFQYQKPHSKICSMDRFLHYILASPLVVMVDPKGRGICPRACHSLISSIGNICRPCRTVSIEICLVSIR